MKAQCANPQCGRVCASAARSNSRLCFGCEYLGPRVLKQVRARAAQKGGEPLPQPAHKSRRRRMSFRKGATA